MSYLVISTVFDQVVKAIWEWILKGSFANEGIFWTQNSTRQIHPLSSFSCAWVFMFILQRLWVLKCALHPSRLGINISVKRILNVLHSIFWKKSAKNPVCVCVNMLKYCSSICYWQWCFWVGLVFENSLLRDCRYRRCNAPAAAPASQQRPRERRRPASPRSAHTPSPSPPPALPRRLTQLPTSSLEMEEKKITSAPAFLKYSEVPRITVGSLHAKGWQGWVVTKMAKAYGLNFRDY